MREIKFRAWNKACNFMMDIDKISFKTNRVYFDNEWWEDFELMQFTGLHDKNGTPIYEGDILRLWCGKGQNGELRREYSYPLSVTYSDLWCQFVVEDKANKVQYGIWQAFNAFEVIGNIYENPELLRS